MGCCASSERHQRSGSPYNADHPSYGETGSRAHIARASEPTPATHDEASPRALPESGANNRSQSAVSTRPLARQISADRSPQQDSRRRSYHLSLPPVPPKPAAQQPNQPLNPPPPHSKVQPPPSHVHYDPLSNAVPPLSRAALLKERRDFFDTRVTGRPEIWAAVKLVCELVEQSSLSDAQAVLDAAGCTCPSGDLWGRKGGIYDERGEKYVVPAWVVAEPPGVVHDAPPDEQEEKSSSNDEEEDEEVSREKGKGKAVFVEGADTEPPKLKVRARLSHTAQDVLVRFREDDKVRAIIKRIRELAKLSPKTEIKIVYLGKILHEHESLAAQGWHEGHAINVYVFEPE